jgi:FkbM family methyltransferase
LSCSAVGRTGALVEPDPRNHKALEDQRSTRLFRCAAGDRPRTFVQRKDSSLSGFLRTSGNGIDVEVRRLNDLIATAGLSDLTILSIDTEGTELEVWSTLDLSKCRPAIVIIEYNTNGIGFHDVEQIERMGRDGYEVVHRTTANLIFVDRSGAVSRK